MALTVVQKAVTLELVAKMDTHGKRIDSITIANVYRDETGECIDWHEFAYYLDELRNKGILRVTQGGGYTQYKLARA